MAKSRSKHQATKYATYKTNQTWAKNRRKKLEKHLKAHPGDAQALTASKNIVYRRKTPQTRLSKTQIATLRVFKLLEGKASPLLLSSNPIVASQARMSHKVPKMPSLSTKGMFSISARAKNSTGEYLYA